MTFLTAARIALRNTCFTPASLPTRQVCDLPVANATREAALDWLTARLDAYLPARIAFLNAHCANVMQDDATYRAAMESADAVLPDGLGVAIAARLEGFRFAANLNGTDLVPALCERLALSGHSVFLLGGRPGVAAKAAATLQAQCPGLQIAGTRHGFFKPEDEDAVIEEINASGASLLLVAFGVPKQDVWLARVQDRLAPVLTMGVGGLFDFLAAEVSRAPALLRRTGMEWTWRLAQEPRRMWRRYLLGNPRFLARTVKQALPQPREIGERVDLGLKRALDVTAAGLGLLALSPLFLMTAAAVKLTSRGPAFLRQTRVGQDGTEFTMFKFRSMYIDAEARRALLVENNQHGADGVTFKMKRDPRVTRIGRVLRKFSIDELPQLWNVLNGTMSLVGPRPQLPTEVARYSASDRRRLGAKPGLTCLWQVSGRANIPFARQVELDVEYLEQRNTLKDLLILVRTVPAVITARGAY